MLQCKIQLKYVKEIFFFFFSVNEKITTVQIEKAKQSLYGNIQIHIWR